MTNKNRNFLLEDLAVSGTIPQDLYNRSLDGFRRIKVESFTTVQYLILLGSGYQTQWRETAIPSSGNNTRYAEFTVPSGFYMALNNRFIETNGTNIHYKVFPSGTYTIGAEKTDDGTDFAKTYNLRQDSVSINPLLRHDISVAPSDTDFVTNVLILGVELQGNRLGGSSYPDDTYRLLSPNQKFLLQITNDGDSTAIIDVLLNYSFISSDDISPLG